MANPLSVVVYSDVSVLPSQGIYYYKPRIRFLLAVGTPGELQVAVDGSNAAFAYWVLDRVNPASGPKWKFLSADPNSVPAGIQPYMDDGHILVFACLSPYLYFVPQGPLHEFLAQNGAGRALMKVEALNSCSASGATIDVGFSYTLVCIPGAAMPAIEDWNYWPRTYSSDAVKVTAIGNDALGFVYTQTDGWVAAHKDRPAGAVDVVGLPENPSNQETRILVFELVPAADGRYMPVRVP